MGPKDLNSQSCIFRTGSYYSRLHWVSPSSRKRSEVTLLLSAPCQVDLVGSLQTKPPDCNDVTDRLVSTADECSERWFGLLLAHANVNLGQSPHTPGSSEGITSFGTNSPVPCRRNVVVPSGTVGLLHKRVKLQQRRWHGAPVLTRFPAPAFFPPQALWRPSEPSLHSSRSRNLVSYFPFFFRRPSLLLRFFEKTLASWKSDVTRPRPQAVVTAMTCTKGPVGNLSTEKKGGSKGLQTQYRPTGAFLPLSVLWPHVSVQNLNGTATKPHSQLFRCLNSMPPQRKRADCAPLLKESFNGGFRKKKKNRPRGRKCFRPWCVCTVRALGGLWVAPQQRLKTCWNSDSCHTLHNYCLGSRVLMQCVLNS